MALAKMEDFIGYGTHHPKVVFLGGEERVPGARPAENIAIHLAEFEPVMDLVTGARLLTRAGFVNPFGVEDAICPRWTWAAAFRLALAREIGCGPEGARWYWRERMARRDDDTFLMDCFLDPADGGDRAAAWPSRREKLASFLALTAPAVVVAHGRIASGKVGELISLQRSWLDGNTELWHEVRGAHVGQSASGAVVARVHQEIEGGLVGDRELQCLAAVLIKLRGNECLPLPNGESPPEHLAPVRTRAELADRKQHRWQEWEHQRAIDICLEHQPGDSWDRAARVFQVEVNAHDPSNPISLGAAITGLEAVANAIDGRNLDRYPRASETLLSIVSRRRANGTLKKKK